MKMMKNAVLSVVALSAIALVACGSDVQPAANADGPIGKAKSAVTSFTLDMSDEDPNTPKTLHTGLYAPTDGDEEVIDPHVCFVTGIHGAFNNASSHYPPNPPQQPDFIKLDIAEDREWVITGVAGSANDDGPTMTIGCIALDRINNNSTLDWRYKAYTVTHDEFASPSGTVTPDIGNGESPAPQGINVWAGYAGRFEAGSKATFLTRSGWLEPDHVLKLDRNIPGDEYCGSWEEESSPFCLTATFAYSIYHLSSTTSHNGAQDQLLGMGNQEVHLSPVDESFCFITGATGSLLQGSDSLTIAAEWNGWSNRDVWVARASGSAGGYVTCIDYVNY